MTTLRSNYARMACAIGILILQPISAGTSAREAQSAARMENWRNQKFGLFIHWGPYSKLGGSYEGRTYSGNTEWIMRTARISRADYRKAAVDFDPHAFRPTELVDFAKRCGFRYVIMTAKHYDGFALFDSKVSDFNAVEVLASKRDLLKELSVACQAGGMPLGFSYSVQRDWYNPGGDTLGAAWDNTQAGNREIYLERVALPQLKELFSGYGPVFALLPDTGGGLSSPLASAFQDALPPSVVTPRAFKGISDYAYTDSNPLERTLAQVDWEKCTSMSDSWGFRKGRTHWKDSGAILRELVQTASRGGNYLLNVGLNGDGQMPKEAVEGLDQVGKWLSAYGESIYGTSASPFMDHPWNGGATVKRAGENSILYLQLFGNDLRKSLQLQGLVTRPLEVEVLGTGSHLAIGGRPGKWQINLEGIPYRDDVTVLRVKLAGVPEMGDGPISADAHGRLRLDVAKGTYSSQKMTLDRSPTAAGLQLTGFSSPDETGVWEVYSDAPAEMKLSLKMDAGPPSKSLAVTVNGGGEIPVSAVASDSTHSLLGSSAFRVPAGSSKIRLALARQKEGPSSADDSAISTSLIELVPSN